MRRWLSARAGLAIFIAVMGVVSLMPADRAAASHSCRSWYGLGCWVGFFTGRSASVYGSNVINGGLYTNDNDKEDFIRKVEGHLNGGSTQNRTGAQFIILTMLGEGARADKNSAGAKIEDWKRRIRSPRVAMRVSDQIFPCDVANTYYTSGLDDVAAGYSTSDVGCGVPNTMIDFYVDGVFYYRIRSICGNPIGDLRGLPTADDWSMEGTSYIDGTDRAVSGFPYVTGRKDLTVWPGDTVRYFHFGRNYGTTTATTQGWAYLQPPTGARQERYYSGIIQVAGNSPWAQYNNNQLTIPVTAQPGQKYCQYIGFFWWSTSQPGVGRDYNGPGQQSCATIGYNYSLVPRTSPKAGQPSVVPAGTTIDFDYRMLKNGSTASQPNTQISFKRFIAGPNVNVNLNPPDYRDGVPNNCANPFAPVCATDVDSYTDPAPFTLADTDMRTRRTINPYTIPANTPAGSKVCFLFAVSPATGPPSNITNRWGLPSCVTVGKQPTVQIYGGDVFSGGNFETVNSACTTPSGPNGIATNPAATFSGGPTVASFGEYGVFSLNTITGFSSGSAFTGDSLTFRNSGSLGNYDTRRCLTDMDTMFRGKVSGTRSAAGLNINSLGDGVYIVNGNLTLPKINNFNSDLRLLVNGTVTFSGNISVNTNAGGRTADNLPRLVIASSGRMVINNNVTEVHAWLQTKDTLYTCNETGGLTVAKCNNPLTITGVVSANRLSLRRTGGAEFNQPGPAERFVMPPYAWVSAYGDGQTGRIYRTTYQLELPPRY